MHRRTLWWERLIKRSFARQRSSAISTRFVSEAAFHERVVAEKIRSTRSGDLCRIVVVYVSNGSGAIVPMTEALSFQVMAVLDGGLRATDSIGWYREGKLVGALLAVERESFMRQCQLLECRLSGMLHDEIPEASDSLRIKICTPDEVQEIDSRWAL